MIMVGEIRDAETAGIALQASLTGHQVFSSLHTNGRGRLRRFVSSTSASSRGSSRTPSPPFSRSASFAVACPHCQ